MLQIPQLHVDGVLGILEDAFDGELMLLAGVLYKLTENPKSVFNVQASGDGEIQQLPDEFAIGVGLFHLPFARVW